MPKVTARDGEGAVKALEETIMNTGHGRQTCREAMHSGKTVCSKELGAAHSDSGLQMKP